MMHALLAFIMDLDGFYLECKESLPRIEGYDLEQQKEDYARITSRATEFKQTLLNRRKDFIPLERLKMQDTQEISDRQALIEDDDWNSTFLHPGDETPRATIVSWSNAVASEIYEKAQTLPGGAQALINMLADCPHPRYWDVLNQIPNHLQNHFIEEGRTPARNDRIQLSSINHLDLTAQITL